MQILALRSSSACLVKPQRASLAGRSSSLPKLGAVPRARNVTVYAADRNTWYPGATPPAYLDGSMPGDYGFDPLRLGANPDSLKWYKEAELTNGRWAMAAVVGILFTDLIGKPAFWEAGAKVDLPFGGLVPLILIEIAVFAVIENLRYEGWKKTGGSGFLFFFPFDPLGLNSKENQIKEVKNGRLAMLAFLGFCSQAAVRGLGPIDCLKLHLDNPGYNNIFTSNVGPEATVAVIALSIAPIAIQARKALGGTEDDFRPIPGPW